VAQPHDDLGEDGRSFAPLVADQDSQALNSWLTTLGRGASSGWAELDAPSSVSHGTYVPCDKIRVLVVGT
jgi:hypothetical protein